MLKSLPIVLACAATSSAQNLLSNPGFETPPAGPMFINLGAGFDMGGWLIDAGDLDLIGGFWPAAQGQQSLDLNGDGPAAIHQDIPTIPGAAYTIRFAFAGNPYGFDNKTMDVSWNGTVIASLTFIQAGHTGTDLGWEYHTLHVTAAGATSTLRFISTTGPMNGTQGFTAFYGPALDDVSLVRSTCYANCDNSTAAPILNVNDFLCFQNRFAAGDSYANCDGSTTPPILNVNDFICFQAAVAAGCP